MLKGQLDAATLFLLCRVMIETPHLKLGRLVPPPYHVPPPYFASLPRLNEEIAICLLKRTDLTTLSETTAQKSPVETGLKIIDSICKKTLYAIPQAAFSSSALSVFSQVNSGSSRPK